MVATISNIATKKKEREQQQPEKKTNNIGKFFSLLFTHLFTLVIVIFFGSNFAYAVNNYASEKYFKTNIHKEPYTQTDSKQNVSWFYRKSNDTGIIDNIRNWSSDTLIYSWSTLRNLIKETFSEINMSRNNLKQTFTTKNKLTSIFHYILDAVLIFLGIWGILLGAFVIFIIGLILPIIGGISSVSHNNKYGCFGFLTYILLSIAAFFTSLNIFTPVLGPLQSLYFIWKVAITPIFNSQPGYYKGILQKYKHIIFVLFVASLLSSAWASLNTLTATGITIGAVISAISWIYSTYG
jgi:hypothetical protein